MSAYLSSDIFDVFQLAHLPEAVHAVHMDPQFLSGCKASAKIRPQKRLDICLYQHFRLLEQLNDVFLDIYLDMTSSGNNIH